MECSLECFRTGGQSKSSSSSFHLHLCRNCQQNSPAFGLILIDPPHNEDEWSGVLRGDWNEHSCVARTLPPPASLLEKVIDWEFYFFRISFCPCRLSSTCRFNKFVQKQTFKTGFLQLGIAPNHFSD